MSICAQGFYSLVEPYYNIGGLTLSFTNLQMQTNPMGARLGVAINLVFLLCLHFSGTCEAGEPDVTLPSSLDLQIQGVL